MNATSELFDRRWHGRRNSRKLTAARQQLLDDLLPRFRVDSEKEISDLPAIFSSSVRDVWMEIGFGAGEHLVGQAAKYKEIGFLGCDPYINGVASLLSKVNKENLSNIKVFDGDVRLLIPKLPSASLGRLFLLYSDPWPKKRHHRRRITSELNINEFARLLKPGGELRFATDAIEFATWTLERILRDPRFVWLARQPCDWQLPPADWIQTRYEQKACARGVRSVYLNFLRADKRRRLRSM